jgi:PA14 domain
MAMHWIGKIGYGVIGAAAAIATAASGAVTLVGSGLINALAVATPVVYPPMSATTHLELSLSNGLPTQLRGLYFDPNERVDIFVLAKPELPMAQYQLWLQVQTNDAGKFDQALNVSPPPNAPSTIYLSARGKRGFVVPVGPISLPKAAPTQAPAPTATSGPFQPTLVPTSLPAQPAAPLPVATPKPVEKEPVNAFYVEVFNNRDLAGTAISTRNEPGVSVNGGNAEAFSARYFGRFTFSGTENYEFVIVADDGVRLLIDGNIVLNEWRVGKSRELRVDVPLTSGEHSVQLEYFHRAGNARVGLTWQVNYSRWEARYYNTPNWTGPVMLKRDDGDTDGCLRMMTWGDGSPGPNVNADNFSVIWERRALFEVSGEYKFNLELDDGAKVYIDGVEVFGNLNAVGTHEFTRKLGRGTHQLQVLYAEYGGAAKMKLEWALIPPPSAPLP